MACTSAVADAVCDDAVFRKAVGIAKRKDSTSVGVVHHPVRRTRPTFAKCEAADCRPMIEKDTPHGI